MDFRSSKQKIHLASVQQHVITGALVSAVQSRQTYLNTGPTWLNLANSNACNLTCIMCGRDRYRDNASLLQKEMSEVNSLLPGLRELFLTGNGDPFARPDTRELLLNLDSSLFPDLKINVLTNGLLLPKYWDRISHLNFGELDISVDAATPGTYEAIRRGGSWQNLLAALELVSRERGRFSRIMINMTVMKQNYREIPSFVELAGRYGVGVGISPVRGKWGSQNIFTSGDAGARAELRGLINQARQRARELEIEFYCSSFNDILSGHEMSSVQRYRQIVIDNLIQLYYRLKP